MQNDTDFDDATVFKASLELLVPLIVDEVSTMRNIKYEEAINLLYSSKLYHALEYEPTKLWHLSHGALADILIEEVDTGKITIPEEA
jgi:hypothetical protein